MTIGAQILVGVIALEHLFIAWLEMFAWTKKGAKFFPQFDQVFLEKTKNMAANQGLYNGFLAAGLLWSILIQDSVWSFNVAIFFLSCVIVAGIYGAMTSSKSILLKQGLPAMLVLIAVYLIH